MNDADYAKTLKRAKKAVAYWITPCGLRMWQRVTFHYARDTAEMAKSTPS